MTDDIENAADANREKSVGRPTRRAALGAGVAAALSGLAGCSALDRLFDDQDESAPADGGSSEADRDFGDGDDRVPLWDVERERRREIADETSPSYVPSYEYDPVEITVDERAVGGIERITAAPAEAASGDRIVIACRPERTERLSELSTLLWVGGMRVDGYESTVEGQSVRFDLFADDATAVGLGTIESDDSTELLVARAADVTAVETLVDTFSDVYDRV